MEILARKSIRQKTKASKQRNFRKRSNKRKKKTENDAKKALETGSVVILINEEIPKGAIAALGKGLNFIPTPNQNIEELRLDMRLVTNKTLNVSKKNLEKETSKINILNNNMRPPTENSLEKEPSEVSTMSNNMCLPAKMRRKKYSPVKESPELAVNNITNQLSSQLDLELVKKKYPKKRQNLTNDEKDGLNWLIRMTNADKLSVVRADKGGAILIVYPELLKKKVMEKLNNPSLYTLLNEDPTKSFHKELYNLWVHGKECEHLKQVT